MNTATPAPDGFAPGVRFRLPDRCAPADPRSIDQLLPAGHPARLLWELACSLDYGELLAGYKARPHRPGKPPVDVRVLVTLWLLATHEGVDSARRLAALCLRHDAYRWVRGGVAVGYHALSDFRVRHGGWPRRRFTAAVAALRQDGLATLARVGQDGLRVRASAGSDSFRTAAQLASDLGEAEARLAALGAQDRQGAAARGGRRRSRKEAALLRGARGRCGRLRLALREIGPAAAAREARKKGDGAKTRLSATDPEARRMKMPDGGFRPAYNAQLATDLDALVVVAAELSNAGNDAGLTLGMPQRLEEDFAARPSSYYADGGYATRQDVEAMALAGVTFYAPIKAEEKQKARGDDPSARKRGESDEVAAWRARMSGEAGKKEYRRRGVTEWSNAQARRCGLYRVTLRGLGKAEAALLWFALALALLRGAALRGRAAGLAGPAEAGPGAGPAEAAGPACVTPLESG